MERAIVETAGLYTLVRRADDALEMWVSDTEEATPEFVAEVTEEEWLDETEESTMGEAPVVEASVKEACSCSEDEKAEEKKEKEEKEEKKEEASLEKKSDVVGETVPEVPSVPVAEGPKCCHCGGDIPAEQRMLGKVHSKVCQKCLDEFAGYPALGALIKSADEGVGVGKKSEGEGTELLQCHATTCKHWNKEFVTGCILKSVGVTENNTCAYYEPKGAEQATEPAVESAPISASIQKTAEDVKLNPVPKDKKPGEGKLGLGTDSGSKDTLPEKIKEIDREQGGRGFSTGGFQEKFKYWTQRKQSAVIVMAMVAKAVDPEFKLTPYSQSPYASEQTVTEPTVHEAPALQMPGYSGQVSVGVKVKTPEGYEGTVMEDLGGGQFNVSTAYGTFPYDGTSLKAIASLAKKLAELGETLTVDDASFVEGFEDGLSEASAGTYDTWEKALEQRKYVSSGVREEYDEGFAQGFEDSVNKISEEKKELLAPVASYWVGISKDASTMQVFADGGNPEDFLSVVGPYNTEEDANKDAEEIDRLLGESLDFSRKSVKKTADLAGPREALEEQFENVVQHEEGLTLDEVMKKVLESAQTASGDQWATELVEQ